MFEYMNWPNKDASQSIKNCLRGNVDRTENSSPYSTQKNISDARFPTIFLLDTNILTIMFFQKPESHMEV